MRRFHLKTLFYIIIPFLGLITPSAGMPESSFIGIDKINRDQPIIINSDTLEIDNKRRIVTFHGNVDARESDLTIKCQKMLLYYKDTAGDQASDNSDLKIDKIIAKGKVKISRSDGGLATADEAVYNQKDETVVLTGKPVVKQGDYFVEGAKITLFLKENRSVVEGSKTIKVRAVMSPRK